MGKTNSPEDDLSEWRRRTGAQSVLAFAQVYLPHCCTHTPSPMHAEISAMLGSASKERGARIALAAPREHAKSTLVTLAYPLWSLCYDHEKYILLFSDSSDQANTYLRHVKNELQENPLLRRDFPRKCEPANSKPSPVRWRENEIITRNGVKITALGSGKKVRGLRHNQYRPSLVILDDVENDDQVNSSERREKLHDWFLKSVINAADAKGNVVVVGTILHWDSLLAKLLKEEGVWAARKYQALPHPDQPIWPSKWPLEALMKRKREIGSHRFEQEFQNNPISLETQVFRPAWIKTYKELPAGLRIFQGVDLAISQKETADYFAIVTIGVDRDCNVFVLDAFRGRLTFGNQIQKIVEAYRIWCPVRVGIESIAYQAALSQTLIKTTAIPVKEIKPTKDKFTRAKEQSVHFENGKVFLKAGQQGDLRDELVEFPKSRHDDMVDALLMAMQLGLADCGGSQQVIPPIFDKGPTMDQILGGAPFLPGGIGWAYNDYEDFEGLDPDLFTS